MRLLNKLSSYSRVLLFLASMVPALAPAANLTAMELIQSMSEAMRNLSYRGNFVDMHDNQLESMSIMHTKNKSGEKEKFYSFELVGKDRIAGQPTAVVQISPKDRFRYGLKFWINQENHLMMKSILVDDNNRAVEQVMFTNLELVSDPADIIFNPVPSIDESFTLVRFHSGDNSGQASSESFWDTHNIPAGFHRKSVLKRHDLASDQYIYQMVYTDGLASLSIFIEKQSPQLKLGKMSMGAVNAYIRLLGDYMVTAIGEVPEVTVKSMAESISYRGK
jgi:sigma-E factor negative regulatory protein RseB